MSSEYELLVEDITYHLALRFSPATRDNPAYGGYRYTPDVEPEIERSIEERMNDVCMVVEGNGSDRHIRALTYREVAEVAARVILGGAR